MRPTFLTAHVSLVLIAYVGLISPARADQSATPRSTTEPTAIETITVTARKREENLQDVAAAVSVISGEELTAQHVTQLVDLSARVPSLQIDSGGSPGQTTITLRGVTPLTEGAPTVGTYIDDAPLGSSNIFNRAASFAIDLLPYDVNRIEVLRGPQGTLYGASAIGGLLKYVTNSPDLSELELRAGAEGSALEGSDESGGGGRFSANVPLIADELAVRASYAYQKTPGYVNNTVTGAEDVNGFTQRSARTALLWQPIEDFSVQLSALWQGADADNNGRVELEYPSLVPIADGRSNANLIADPFESRLEYYSATIKWHVAGLDFTSVTTYSDSATDQIVDGSRVFGIIYPLFGLPAGLAPFELDLGVHKTTQELRVASPTGSRFEWLFGGFYTDESARNDQLLNAQSMAGAPLAGLDPLLTFTGLSDYEEVAGFGEATWHFTEAFDVAVGLRWAENRQSFHQNGGGVFGIGEIMGSSSEGVWTYMVSPTYHFTPDTMLYARVASGYSAGGPNIAAPGIPPEVDSDTAVNSELGLKSVFMDGRATLELAAYRVTRSDIQISVVRNGVGFLANGGRARSQGVEVSTTFAPTRQLRLGLNGAYTDAELREDAPELDGLAGDRLPNTPRFSGAFTVDVGFSLSDDWQGNVGTSVRYVGSRFSEIESSDSSVESGSYTVADAYASVNDDRWTVRLFVKNLANSDGEISRSLVSDAFGSIAYGQAILVQPRTVGLAVDVSF